MQRRTFLAGAATAGAATLAGCSVLSGDGSGSDEGVYDQVARWALAPAGGTTPDSDYSIGTLDPAAALAARDGLDAGGLPGSYADSFLWQTLPASDVERVIEIETDYRMQPGDYRIFEGDLDVDRVTAAFEEMPNYDAADLGSYDGYRCFDSGDGFFLHGVTDGRAIEIDRLRGDDLDRSAIERVVDAGAGDAERITERHDGVAAVADRLEPRHYSSLGVVDPDREPDPESGVFAGVTASAASAEVRPEEAHVRAIVAFRDEAALEAADTERWVAESQGAPRYSKLSVETDGRVLIGELTTSAGEVFGN